jgi:hypothetical protein
MTFVFYNPRKNEIFEVIYSFENRILMAEVNSYGNAGLKLNVKGTWTFLRSEIDVENLDYIGALR